MKIKITEEGQPCRKCGTPVIKKLRDLNKPIKDKSYYFKSFFDCPKCNNRYMNEEDKVFTKSELLGHQEKSECEGCQFKLFFETMKKLMNKA